MNGTKPSPAAGIELLHTLDEDGQLIFDLAWSPDGQMLASAHADGTVRLWYMETGKLQHPFAPGFKFAPTTEPISHLAWAPDSKTLAVGAVNGTIYLWDLQANISRLELNGNLRVVIGDQKIYDPIFTMTWIPNRDMLCAYSRHSQFKIWDTKNGREIIRKQESAKVKIESNGVITSFTNNAINIFMESLQDRNIPFYHAPDYGIFQFISSNEQVLLYQSDHIKLQNIFSEIPIRNWFVWNTDALAITHSPHSQEVALALADGTIQIWDMESWATTHTLEGHTDSVISLSFSSDGSLLASRSVDNIVRIWRTKNWESVAIFNAQISGQGFSPLAFHPTKPLLALTDLGDTAIRIFELQPEILLERPPVAPTAHFVNVKVVLLGDSGVGKSGLGLRLSEGKFEPTESTHGRRVWSFDKQTEVIAGNSVEQREIMLWDLAGQPGYRLVHQLHLNQVAIALVVFDARSELDPFAGVRYWDRALRLAERVQGGAASIKKFLVAARADRGGIGVSAERIQRLLEEHGFEEVFETSAKEGWGVDELARAIRDAIDWAAQPRVSSTRLFQQIKEFLIGQKETGRLLSTLEDLYHFFLERYTGQESAELRGQFETCIGRLEAQGLIRRLSFGGFVLLQPELLDAYASALINAAKDEPDGLGSIAEEDIRAGRFRISDDERIKDRDQESLLLISTSEELLRHEIALREHADDGPYLVFPSQLTREWPDAPDPAGQTMILRFEGAVISIYATLAVRLSRSGIFTRKEAWKNAVIFTNPQGGQFGLFLRERGEGKGEFLIFYDEHASTQLRQVFEHYVLLHLERRGLAGSVEERRLLVCVSCGRTLPDQQVQYRLSIGKPTITCGYCDAANNIAGPADNAQAILPLLQEHLPVMEQAANLGREQDLIQSILQGKVATDDIDLFLCCDDHDRQAAQRLDQQIREGHGFLPHIYHQRSWTELKVELRATLADLFQDRATIERIVDDTGIPRGQISLTPRAIDTWHSIIEEGAKHNKLGSLLDTALREYADNTRLLKTRNRFLFSAKTIVVLLGGTATGWLNSADVDHGIRSVLQAGRPVVVAHLASPGQQIQPPELLAACPQVDLSHQDATSVDRLLRQLGLQQL